MISILMPVKNAGAYLHQCLDSIIQQTEENWELVAINDHSDDDSFMILQEYAKSEQRIKPLNNEGHGIINALRLALKNSTGEHITRMDADDIMKPKKLELLAEQLTQNGKGSLAVGLVKYFSAEPLGNGYIKYEKWLNEITSEKLNYLMIYKECSIPSPAWMLHRDDLDLCGAFEPDIYPEDYDLAFRMRAAKFKLYPTTEVVHLWRDHATRSSRTSDDYADNRFLELKANHFVKDDFDTKKNLVLWGAGKKGKKIARLLSEKGVNFDWVTNNPNKIGREINGVFLKSDDYISSLEEFQVIVAVAQPEEQKEISIILTDKGMELGKDSFFFC